ncbi:uncharacterized protein [Ranitomeya imitator]|uniref:uncharacterized protein n=1 Tax=Ranitomeya imitator TaxID=111125 RepID=UPI0037E7D7C1
MDYKARESVWRKKATNMFNGGASGSNTVTSVSDKEMFRQYKNVMYKKTRLWWTKTALENYVEHEIVPRGLRVQLFPTFELKDEKLIKRWSSAASACSLEFLRIIIDSNTQAISEIENELDKLEDTMRKEIKKESLEAWSGDFNNDMEKWENEICQRKVKKYHRDVKDYEENRVFRWQWKRNYTETNRQRQPSFSSLSSTSETSTSSLNREPNMITRFGSRRNDQKRQADIFTRTSKNREDNFKVINLSNHSLTDVQHQVLAKGLTFSPSKHLDPFVAVKDLHLFSRRIILKRMHYKSELDDMFPSTQEKEALANLEALAEENSTTSFIVSTSTEPQPHTIKVVES